jgi:VWFA-related protein
MRLFFISALLCAQAPEREVTIHSHIYTPPSATLRAETTLVEANLVARDARGNSIGGLGAADFEVLDNGVAQKIVAFSELRSGEALQKQQPGPDGVPPAEVPAAQPKYVTFFFDDFHYGASLWVMKAARAFIAKGLKPGQFASIVTASGQGDLDFTGDAQVFAEKLNHVASHERATITAVCGVDATESYMVANYLDAQIIEKAIAAASPCACWEGEKPQECRSKALPVAQSLAQGSWEQTQLQSINTIDALGLAAKRLSQKDGERILVLSSAGFLLRAGEPALERLIDGAVKWGVTVHAIDGNSLGPASGLLKQSLYWAGMEKLAEGTGGRLFKNTNDLAGAMDLAANPQIEYLLAFNPGPRDGKFHNLKIRFRAQKPWSVQFRPGYFSPSPTEKRPPTPRDAMDAAVFSGEALKEISADIYVGPGAERNSVTITVTVNMSALDYTEGAERHGQQIVFLMTLLDAQGAFVAGKEAVMDLALSDQRLESMKQDGLKGIVTLAAPPGAYRVRAIVREGMKGKLSAWTVPVELK